MNTVPALLLAAAGVGLGHAVMPDHWLPLAVLSRTRRYRTARVLRLSLGAAFAHVAVSLVLGGILFVIGLQFRATVARHADLFVGGVLIATGAVFLVLELLGKHQGHGHSHEGNGDHYGRGQDGGDQAQHHGHGVQGGAHHHDHVRPDPDQHDHAYRDATTAVLERPEPAVPQVRTARGLTGLLIPFGAAASPDLTILPVFLAASALGTAAALGSLAAFTLTTLVTIVGLTTATALGARLCTAPWVDRRANLITALTLIAIGVLAASGVI